MVLGARVTKKHIPSHRSGFTLIEILITIAVFSIMLMTVVGISTYLERLTRANLGRSSAVAIAEEYMELARNLPYDQVGTNVTFPTGPLPSSFTTTRNNIIFYGVIEIDQIDDPADQTACVGNPPPGPCDTVPADYKRIEVRICVEQATCTKAVRLTTTIVPKNIETASNTGALFITVLNANGDPVSGATVTVTNTSGTPANPIQNSTDVYGKVQLLSLPPSQNNYHIAVTKSGYTTTGTITPGAPNPNPLQPDVSVIIASVTSVTLAMDQVSSLILTSLNQSDCLSLGSVTYHLRGQRLVGTSPDVYLIDQDITIGGSGQTTVSNLPWDNYTVSLITPGYDVAGLSPPDAIIINPGSNVTASVSTAPHQNNTLRTIIRASGTNAPLAGAQVHVTGSGYDQTITTDQGSLEQTDWSGGSGQTNFTNPARYLNHTGAPDITTNGEVSILATMAALSTSETFDTTDKESTTDSTADWDTANGLIQLPYDSVLPGRYVTSAVAQSIKLNPTDGLITKATLAATDQDNDQTIEYALTSDGTTFETVTPGVEHVFSSPGSDLRWRVTLQTVDLGVTPTVSDLAIDFTQLQRPVTNATITSSTYDSGSPTNYVSIIWNPSLQPAPTGSTPVRFQVAANNDQSTWNYLGPDATGSTYFTAPNSSLPVSLNGNRYFRYKFLLSTDSPLATPTVSYIQIVKNNACTPPGQAFFSPLSSGDYTVDVDLNGYDPASLDLTVNGQITQTITLTPS